MFFNFARWKTRGSLVSNVTWVTYPISRVARCENCAWASHNFKCSSSMWMCIQSLPLHHSTWRSLDIRTYSRTWHPTNEKWDQLHHRFNDVNILPSVVNQKKFECSFKAVIATGLKPGTTILQSLHYTRWKFCAPPTSGLDVVVVSITRSWKSAILCLTLELHHFR